MKSSHKLKDAEGALDAWIAFERHWTVTESCPAFF
jgi:hypothetical protein